MSFFCFFLSLCLLLSIMELNAKFCEQFPGMDFILIFFVCFRLICMGHELCEQHMHLKIETDIFFSILRSVWHKTKRKCLAWALTVRFGRKEKENNNETQIFIRIFIIYNDKFWVSVLYFTCLIGLYCRYSL